MRLLGLDVGSKTVGVAISDPLGITAQELETIKNQAQGKVVVADNDDSNVQGRITFS